MLAAVRSAVLEGVDGRIVIVEVHVSRGLPGYTVVGLPDAAGRESRERVRAALLSSGLEYPQQRVTVNLAPASVRKTGAGLELGVALALTCAAGGLPSGALDGVAVLGELGLDGGVRPVVGTLALVDALARTGVECVIVPAANASEAALVRGVDVRVARTLGELHLCLKGEAPWPDPPDPPPTVACAPEGDEPLDLADVRGLKQARLALAVAAAGSHHLLMVGPPGVGKTMLARRLPTILAPLEHGEALEVTKIHSAAGSHRGPALRVDPPFRQPHHSASMVSLVGGGSSRVRPGEVSLAHRGALFLDELPEFPVHALEALRQPLEERVVRVSRAAGTTEFPADFLLVACANPCPCGRNDIDCKCGDVQRTRYARRLSAPLLDRFDLRIKVEKGSSEPGESSEVVAARVAVAVARQQVRLRDTAWRRNAHIPAGALERYLPLPDDARRVWVDECATRDLTGRGAARIRRVARTIADLDDASEIGVEHVERASWMPRVLLGEGDRPDAFDAPRVAIVGTRAATPMGIADATEIGAFCARAGITVVSGLAIGIDGAAHTGALDAGGLTVGVVATGLDVTYPRRHERLYERVREQGLIVGENEYGTQPLPWRFPVRNRIIAALADAVVVVEATTSGGARITANDATRFGRDVYALPGSRRNPAAAGCNQLLLDGAQPLLDPADVLFALGRGGTVEGGWNGPSLPVDPDEMDVLLAFAGDPASIDQIESRVRLSTNRLGAALRGLERAGHLERKRGLWWPR